MTAILMLFAVLAAEPEEISYPIEYKGTVAFDDPSGLQWHKWQTKDFTIMAINEQQGAFLAKNIRDIKKWIFSRWGLPDINFSAECRLFCVYDRAIMRKLFNGLDESRVEVRSKQGRIEVSVGWLLLDGPPARTIPVPLTEICLSELSQLTGRSMNYCLIKGMSQLNAPVDVIKNELQQFARLLKGNSSVYLSEALFAMTCEQWERLKPEDRKLFDRECMVLCLLLRKEFGEDKLLSLIKNGPNVLMSVYGFRDFKQFDASFARYMRDLSSDVMIGKTPDSYLDIVPKRR